MAATGRQPLLREALTYLASVGVTTLVTAWALRLWRLDLAVPWGYTGDAVAVGAHVKTVLETGWYERQPLLGWPAGQTYHDFPTADNLNFVAVRMLGLVSHDWPTVLNLYYLLGFPLAALTATWFLRRVGVSRWLTVTLATLFAIAPYHFLRGESHLWLASYFTVPLALAVVLDAMRGEPLWPDRRRWREPSAWWPAVRTVGGLALVTSSSTYYGVFALLLLAAAGLAAWLRSGDHRRLLGAVAAGLVVVVTVGLNMAPDVLYARAHGSSAAGFVRNRAEAEVYALKLSQLVLPVPGHRVGLLADLRAKYDSGYPLMSEQPALGVVAAAGLVIAFGLLAWAVAGRGRGPRGLDATGGSPASSRSVTLAHLSFLTLVAFLLATVGGLSTFISFLTASLRGWNRMSIVIAALCLGVVGLVLDAGAARLARRGVPWRLAGPVLAGLLLLVGSLDQVTPGAAPDGPVLEAAYLADAAWVHQVEAALPPGAAVVQLPYAGFPETPPVNGVYDTDQLKGYLHSATLHWSGGGIKGRPTTDWVHDVAQLPGGEMARRLAVAGASAVMVDRAALGLPAAGELERELAAETGTAVAVSADGRYALYRLTALADRLAAGLNPHELAAWREAVLSPVRLYPGPDAEYAAESSDQIEVDAGGGLLVESVQDQPVPVVLALELASDAPSVTLTVGALTTVVDTSTGTGQVEVSLVVHPGRTPVVVGADGAAVTVTAVTVREPDLPPLG